MSEVHEILRCKRFELVDDDGQVWASLGLDAGEARFRLCNPGIIIDTGISMGTQEGAGFVSVNGAQSKIVIVQDDNGDVQISRIDHDGTRRHIYPAPEAAGN